MTQRSDALSGVVGRVYICHYYGISWPNKARVKQKLFPTHYEYTTSQVDVVQALIRDRVAVASSQETGRDLEHCVVLIRKFDDFQKV